MNKRLISILLTLLMLISVFPAASAAPDIGHGHSRELLKVVATGNCPTELCGLFYCEDCGETYYAPITSADIGMPVINVTIDTPLGDVTKEEKTPVRISYEDGANSFESDATIKLQGGTSVRFVKKNYSLQLLKEDGSKNKVCLVDSWGKQSKYCLKANYVDFSQGRNIVSARIFNEIVHSRDIDDELAALPNGGLIDGFPVVVFVNGGFHGLYTMNIPKDKWAFGMKDTTERQAILFADKWSTSVQLFTEIKDVNDVEADNWELEYCSTEDDESVGTAWVAESMNDFIRFLNSNNGESFRAGIGKYTDVDRAIDVLIYTYFIRAEDNLSKNIIWVTYDGTKWIPSVYDMDGTWGMSWNGDFNTSADSLMPAGDNLLFARLLENYGDEIKARYLELRGDILSADNILIEFAAWFAGIPQHLYTSEHQKWPTVPRSKVNNYDQIVTYVSERTAALDEWFGVTVSEKTTYERLSSMTREKFDKLIYGTKAMLPFTDTATCWAQDGIAFTYGTGLMMGVTNELFSPDRTTNRAMIVTILYRLEGEPEVSAENPFVDLGDDEYCTDAVKWASANGIVAGYEDGSFRGTRDINREQLAAILYRYAKYKGLDTGASNDISGFADFGLVGGFAVEALSWANAMGYVNGNTATTLNPKGSATRAQLSAILMRFCADLAVK